MHFRKQLSGNILKEINALILEKSKADDEGRDDGDEGKGAGEGEAKEPENKGTLIVDATCAPEDMRFPNDVTLLDEARRKTERIIDCLQNYALEGYEKPRTYRKKAKSFFVALFDILVERVRRAFGKRIWQLVAA